ncbi:flagellar assembly protein T N-terminal domain-containing protein [Psychrosphaera aestuarii]|uniref:flagellar assembly protein T N-terminal domain-containing protein n=1 Tax=Psychrosphaera aestuarii TaxID=1266052 RepID=UPI001B31BF45|nr:flagellar assembly protein T N-terminal domain-containing protein [Psychrosphaera aestuarii]
MTNYFVKFIVLMTLSVFSATTLADWYEATGQARVRHGDVASAKNRAMQDAVKQAMLFSGANVSSIQQISKGLLVDDSIQVRSNGAVNRIEIVSELQRGDSISVTIRADIFPEERACYAAEFGKKVAITQFPIQHWEHAKIGGLYGLEKEIPRKILSMLQSGSSTIYPVAWFEKKLNVNIDFEQQGRVRHELIDAVAQNANTQFVMFGRISDLSFGDVSNSFSFWEDDEFERFFTFDLMIANALTHEVIYQNRFRTEADWTFDKRDTVNVSSRKFWNSEYGSAIERNLTDMRDDILSQLSCQQLQSKILAIQEGKQIQLNIGRGQGVYVGQEYRVSYRADIVDNSGNLLTNFVISPYRVKITQVYENSAIAESLDKDFMSNVQVNDVIELKDWATDW